MSCVSSVIFFSFTSEDMARRPLGEIRFVRGSPEWLRGLENVTRTYVDWVEFLNFG